MQAKLTLRLKANPHVRAVFRLEPGAFLVGGAVRDYLHCVIAGKPARGIDDYDFILPGADIEGRVGVIRKSTGGTLIRLGNEGLVRIALRNGKTLDFTPLNEPLDANLASRDFTINSIAWSWTKGMVDPLGGLSSIIKGAIRHTSEASLAADPLRLLRAYRFLSEKGWVITPDTRATIKRLASLASAPAKERIFAETVKLCNGAFFNDAFHALLSDTMCLAVYSIKSGHYGVLLHALHHIERFSDNPLFRNHFRDLPSGLSRAGILRLMTILLHSESPDAGLSLPGALVRRASLLRKSMEFLKSHEPHQGDTYDLFKIAGQASADLLIISGQMELASDLRMFHRIHARPVLETSEIMRITGLGEGKPLGSIIEELHRQAFTGAVKSKRDAKSWLVSLRNHWNPGTDYQC